MSCYAKSRFWAIDRTKDYFGKDGWWYANDERIQNRRINVLFSQYLRRTADGTYEIAIGWDKVAVEIEDTAYVVTRVTGDTGAGFTLRLNDESEEQLDPTSLSIGQGHVLYCRVKGGRPQPVSSVQRIINSRHMSRKIQAPEHFPYRLGIQGFYFARNFNGVAKG